VRDEIIIVLLRCYNNMSGADYGAVEGTALPHLTIFLLVIFVAITTILLLNLLIAIMGNAYNEIQENMDAEARLQRCCVILDQIRFWEVKTPKHVFCLKRLDDVQADEDADMSRKLLADVKKELDTVKQDLVLLPDVKGELQTMKQELGSLKQDLHEMKGMILLLVNGSKSK
jgi:hypothetical protein